MKSKKSIVTPYANSRVSCRSADEDALLAISSLPRLNQILGGGFAPKESAYFVAETGAGKTAFGVQLMVDLALAGKKVAMITARESTYGIAERCYGYASATANPPDHGNQGKARERFEAVFEGHCFVEPWNRKKELNQRLIDTVMSISDQIGALDFLILDSIDGTVGLTDDFRELRRRLEARGDELAALAREQNLACLTFNHANPVQARNQRHVTPLMGCYCKTIGRHMTWNFGLSRVHNESSEPEDNAGGISDKQWIYCSKGPRGQGTAIPVAVKPYRLVERPERGFDSRLSPYRNLGHGDSRSL